ncbi:MAG: hypothetical protein ABL931_04580 [Usitatibacteraceae bacterium]
MEMKNVMVVAVAVLISAALIAGNNWLSARGAVRYAVVDVLDIYKDKEREFSALILKPNASEAERARAVDLAQDFGKRLDAALKQLPAECGCVLLNRSAVVASNGIKDYTDELKALLATKSP